MERPHHITFLAHVGRNFWQCLVPLQVSSKWGIFALEATLNTQRLLNGERKGYQFRKLEILYSYVPAH
jgi:hypothetical protein